MDQLANSKDDGCEHIHTAIVNVISALVDTCKTRRESPIEGILCNSLYRDLGYRRGSGVFDPSVIPRLRELSKNRSAAWVFTQHDIGRYRVDILLVLVPEVGPAELLIIECDGREFHSSAAQIAYDHKRDQEIQNAGYALIRFTGSDIYRRTDWVLREIVRCLGSVGADICRETGKYPRPAIMLDPPISLEDL